MQRRVQPKIAEILREIESISPTLAEFIKRQSNSEDPTKPCLDLLSTFKKIYKKLKKSQEPDKEKANLKQKLRKKLNTCFSVENFPLSEYQNVKDLLKDQIDLTPEDLRSAFLIQIKEELQVNIIEKAYKKNQKRFGKNHEYMDIAQHIQNLLDSQPIADDSNQDRYLNFLFLIDLKKYILEKNSLRSKETLTEMGLKEILTRYSVVLNKFSENQKLINELWEKIRFNQTSVH